MILTLSNMLRISGNIPIYVREYIREQLAFTNPHYTKLRKLGKSTYYVNPKIEMFAEVGNLIIAPEGFAGQLDQMAGKESN
jgi:hypothetical protein